MAERAVAADQAGNTVEAVELYEETIRTSLGVQGAADVELARPLIPQILDQMEQYQRRACAIKAALPEGVPSLAAAAGAASSSPVIFSPVQYPTQETASTASGAWIETSVDARSQRKEKQSPDNCTIQ